MSICDVCPVKQLGEVWADIPGLHPTRHRYQVSTEGRVRNADTLRLLRARSNVDSGYAQISLGRANRDRLLHRLVLAAFIGPAPRDELGRTYEGDHLDWDRTRNHVTNLRWLPKNVNAWRWRFWTDHPQPEDMGIDWTDPDHPEHAAWLAQLATHGWPRPMIASPNQLHRGHAPAAQP